MDKQTSPHIGDIDQAVPRTTIYHLLTQENRQVLSLLINLKIGKLVCNFQHFMGFLKTHSFTFVSAFVWMIFSYVLGKLIDIRVKHFSS